MIFIFEIRSYGIFDNERARRTELVDGSSGFWGGDHPTFREAQRLVWDRINGGDIDDAPCHLVIPLVAF